MLWITLSVAVVAVILAGVTIWLMRALARERGRSHELLYEKIDLENRLDSIQSEQFARNTAQETMAAVADRLDAPLGSVRAHFESLNAQLDDYRRRVREFDAAVQYCLQPVEMIFGADKATMDQLVCHVEGARRKLFQARAELQKSPLHVDANAIDGGLEEIEVLADYARALRVPLPAPAEIPVDEQP